MLKNNESNNKKLILKEKTKESVDTSQGTFFARYLSAGDLDTFSKYFSIKNKSEVDFISLGKLAIETLICSDAESRDAAISKKIYAALSEADIQDLVNAIAKAEDVEMKPSDNVLYSLGESLFDAHEETFKYIENSSAQLKHTLDRNFSSLPTALRTSLGENFAGLSSISKSLNMSPAVETMRKAQESFDRAGGNSLSKILGKTLDPFGGALGNAAATRGILDSLNNQEKNRLLTEKAFSTPLIPKYEETGPGRAAARTIAVGEESARQLREVAGLVGQMADQMNKLQTMFLTEVLPQWFTNLDENSKSANTSLRWAKWALIASVVATVLMTGWQVWLAREYKIENDTQQAMSESLLRQQITEAKELNKQLAADSKALRQELMSMKNQSKNISLSQVAESERQKIKAHE